MTVHDSWGDIDEKCIRKMQAIFGNQKKMIIMMN